MLPFPNLSPADAPVAGLTFVFMLRNLDAVPGLLMDAIRAS